VSPKAEVNYFRRSYINFVLLEIKDLAIVDQIYQFEVLAFQQVKMIRIQPRKKKRKHKNRKHAQYSKNHGSSP
jgi:hypothetical protein